MERVLQSGYQATDISQDVLSGGQGHAASRILEAETVEDLSVRRRAREVGVTPANHRRRYGGAGEVGPDHHLARA